MLILSGGMAVWVNPSFGYVGSRLLSCRCVLCIDRMVYLLSVDGFGERDSSCGVVDGWVGCGTEGALDCG